MCGGHLDPRCCLQITVDLSESKFISTCQTLVPCLFRPALRLCRDLDITMHPVRKAILVVCILLPFLATLSVYFRFRARRTRKLPLLLDDWSALVALVSHWKFMEIYAYPSSS